MTVINYTYMHYNLETATKIEPKDDSLPTVSIIGDQAKYTVTPLTSKSSVS